jgi:hypothetical protein
MHVTDLMLDERKVPLMIEQPGPDPRDMCGQPPAMAEGNPLVLIAVEEQDGKEVAHLMSRTPCGQRGSVSASFASPISCGSHAHRDRDSSRYLSNVRSGDATVMPPTLCRRDDNPRRSPWGRRTT